MRKFFWASVGVFAALFFICLMASRQDLAWLSVLGGYLSLLGVWVSRKLEALRKL
jgi:hypothetical protein